MVTRRGSRTPLVRAALCTAIVAIAVGAVSVAQAQTAEHQIDEALVTRGAAVFQSNCAACHGKRGQGGTGTGDAAGPPVREIALAYFDLTVRTGRMPIADRSLGVYTEMLSEADREAVVAYAAEELDNIGVVPTVEPGDPARGQELYVRNCAACHGPTAQGVAVGQQDVSSTLDITEPIEIATAIRSGPGVMPRFTEDTLNHDDLLAVTAWVMDLREREAPGGWSLGRSGTVAEGLIAVVVGLGLLAIVMYLLGESSRDEEEPTAERPDAGGGHEQG